MSPFYAGREQQSRRRSAGTQLILIVVVVAFVDIFLLTGSPLQSRGNLRHRHGHGGHGNETAVAVTSLRQRTHNVDRPDCGGVRSRTAAAAARAAARHTATGRCLGGASWALAAAAVLLFHTATPLPPVYAIPRTAPPSRYYPFSRRPIDRAARPRPTATERRYPVIVAVPPAEYGFYSRPGRQLRHPCTLDHYPPPSNPTTSFRQHSSHTHRRQRRPFNRLRGGSANKYNFDCRKDAVDNTDGPATILLLLL